MSIINQFIEDYKCNMEHYEKLAWICAFQCENGLKRRGLRALVTYRVKRLDSLMAKVKNRSLKKNYKTLEDIYDDIIDLAGVRIALYFPRDEDSIDSFLRASFEVEHVKNFPEAIDRIPPYPKRFSGYAARHYRLRLRKESLPRDELTLAECVIEVQVGSVLMHAWAEVEHDLIYKSRAGQLSHDEHAILDELNGLMHAGEIALERLQRAVKRRINNNLQPFSNHYELASFLDDYLQEQLPPDSLWGRTDILFQFLKDLNLNSVAKLTPILRECDFNSENTAVTARIVNAILNKNPAYRQAYTQACSAAERIDPGNVLGRADLLERKEQKE